ncbi:MAG TPA: hypothetical protein VEA69_08215 [Tepidisphaeraceae bacterium]|nr:hypothetical protein [Tepidisphaeraceae bacterium]
MTRKLNWLMAATLGVGGIAFTGCDRDNKTTANNNPSTTGDGKVVTNPGDAARTAGANLPGDQIGTVDLSSIYNALHEPVDAAFDDGDLGDAVEYFGKADRDRIGKMQESAELKGAADTFTKAWNGKYNAKFDVGDDVLKNWVMVQKSGETNDVTMANAMIPASHGLPAVTIPLVKDNLKWRLDVPDTLNGQMVHDAVKNSLNKVGTMSGDWAKDQLDAKRHVLHAFYAELFGAK